MIFSNDYQDRERAAAYAGLAFPGTYELAFRYLPEIIRRQVSGGMALDFGCGAGRSTRFLADLGFRTTGVDIAVEMLEHARRLDPNGDYRLISDQGGLPFSAGMFDLVFSAFTFDNIPTWNRKIELFRELGRILRPGGKLVNLVSTPEIYRYEWMSFSTVDFPENRSAKVGDLVRIVNTSSGDRGPVSDVLWPDEAYREVYSQAGLELLEMRKLLAGPEEESSWINETRIAPWCVYVLRSFS